MGEHPPVAWGDVPSGPVETRLVSARTGGPACALKLDWQGEIYLGAPLLRVQIKLHGQGEERYPEVVKFRLGSLIRPRWKPVVTELLRVGRPRIEVRGERGVQGKMDRRSLD